MKKKQDKTFRERECQYKIRDEFIISLGVQIGKDDLSELLCENQKNEIYEFSKGIIENIFYDFQIRNLSNGVLIDYLKINQVISKYSQLLTLPKEKTILDYCYLVLKDDVLQMVINNKSNQEIIVEALIAINKKRIEDK